MSVEIVVGHPYSDIGKGWLTASVGLQMKDPLLFKVDPALMDEMPPGFGVVSQGEYVTTDAATYFRRGHAFPPSQNIFMGNLIADGIRSGPSAMGLLREDRAPVVTHADISSHLAGLIGDQIDKAGTSNAVIEVGGCPDDPEAAPIPGAARLLHCKYGGGIILLTTFGSNNEENGNHCIKTRVATRAIETTMKAYWGLPLDYVFIRRSGVSPTIGDDDLREACDKVAFKTQQDPSRVIFLPNVIDPEEIDAYTSPIRDHLNSN